jgi:hypothetical protein
MADAAKRKRCRVEMGPVPMNYSVFLYGHTHIMSMWYNCVTERAFCTTFLPHARVVACGSVW